MRICYLLLLLFPASLVDAQTLVSKDSKLQWDQVADSALNAQGYKYELYVNEGLSNFSIFTLEGVTCTGSQSSFVCTSPIPVMQVGTHQLKLRAIQIISGPSNVVEAIVNAPDDRCVFPTGMAAITVFPTRMIFGGPKANISFQLSSGNPIVRISILLNDEIAKTLEGSNLTSAGSMWIDKPVTPGSYKVSIRVQNLLGCTSVISTSFIIYVT